VRPALAATTLAVGLALAACGGDDDSAEPTAPTVSIPAVTSPIPATTTAAPATTTTPTGPTGGGSGGTSPPSGGTPPKGANPKRPDSPTNDVPPPPGSPQEAFEKQCEQNPAACG
jgi:hypothetical protein